MKGKINLKTIIVVVVMILVGVLLILGMSTAKTLFSSASAGFEPKAVMATPGEDGKSVTVTWTSDKPSMGVVEYGTTPASLLLRAIESTEVTSHKVVLSPLKSNTNYYYRIRVGDDPPYDNNGIPFNIKTTAAADGGESAPVDGGDAAAMPTAAPTIAAVPTVSSGSGQQTCNRTTDYNNDGAINSLDYLTCIRSGGTSGASTSPAPTSSAAAPTAGATDCNNVDFDHNGVINSIDRIKCLQSTSH